MKNQVPVIQRKAEPPPPGRFNTLEEGQQEFLKTTPDNITQDDITKELYHKTKHQEYCYDNFYGKKKLPNAKYLSSKAKRSYIMEFNKNARRKYYC